MKRDAMLEQLETMQAVARENTCQYPDGSLGQFSWQQVVHKIAGLRVELFHCLDPDEGRIPEKTK